MFNTNEILYFILAVFLIGLTSCERELNITTSKQKLTKQANDNAKLSFNDKLEGSKAIEITLHFDYEVPKNEILAILENFLQKENLNFYIQDKINMDKSIILQLNYNKENGRFEVSSTKMNEIENQANSVDNQIITIDNVDWNFTTYRIASTIGPRTILAVETF